MFFYCFSKLMQFKLHISAPNIQIPVYSILVHLLMHWDSWGHLNSGYRRILKIDYFVTVADVFTFMKILSNVSFISNHGYKKVFCQY